MEVNFDNIKTTIEEIYHSTKHNKSGNVADYIPQLSKVNPDLFGISVCTINGEQYDIGDTDIDFCMQSCSKPILYCIAQTLLGEDKVHEHVGYEPSGQKFNAFFLNDENKPHNPMINSGAIMTSSLILSNREPADRFSHVIEFAKNMAGNSGHFGFDNCVYLSERQHAHRNFALSHFMAENDSFPQNTDIVKTLELYFQVCSILTNTHTMGIIASTLANNGKCPLTGEQIISPSVCKNCLSLMYMCGMYDYSGRFAFEIGLPAKSGVSGCLLLVIPNIMGICIWSPPLDKIGNSIRGVEVCQKLVKKYNFHIFDRLIHYCPNISGDNLTESDSDSKNEDEQNHSSYKFILAASKGNLDKMIKLIENKNVDINTCDYDKRTALHLAAAEGHIEIIKYLLDEGANKLIKDRWGNTPYHEANKRDFNEICSLLEI